jgi:hypothetical protein
MKAAESSTPPRRSPLLLEKVAALLKSASALSIAATLVAIVYFVVRYDVETLDALEATRLSPYVSVGSNVVLTDVDVETPLGAGSLVEIEVADDGVDPAKAPRRFTRLVASEGALVSWIKTKDGRYDLKIDGRSTTVFSAPRPSEGLSEGPVQAGFFVAIDPSPSDDDAALLVDRSRIRRKIVFAGWGR